MSESVIRWEDIKDDPNARAVHNAGFVYLKSVNGTDTTIAEAARISYGKGTKSTSDDRHLIRYLMRHQHTSPFEQVSATFIFKLPLFVMGQLVRHRTAKLNQYSGRYSEMPDEYFIPAKWRKQSTTNKQGSSNEEFAYKSRPYVDVKALYDEMPAEDVAYSEYKYRLENGVSRELARTCLPQSQYTLCVWQCDLHNLMHFLKLRMDAHAQEEIRDYAYIMYDMMKEKFPVSMEAFDDYRLMGSHFSKQEMEILKSLWKDHPPKSLEFPGLSKREQTEFAKKLDLNKYVS